MRSEISSEVFRATISKSLRAASQKVFNTVCVVVATTRAVHFPRQENFCGEIENKIHFFLVAFATDF
jgi:hypothetical protein